MLLFSQEKERLQRALAKNLSLVSAKRRAEAHGLGFDYATGQTVQPNLPGTSAKRQKTNTVKNTSVYVSGLPADVSDQELATTFGRIGALRKLKIYRHPDGQPKGDALVTYDLKAGDAAIGAERLLNGKDLRPGWRMSVSLAEFGGAKQDSSTESSAAAGSEGGGAGNGEARRAVLLRNVFSVADAKSEPNFVRELEEDLQTECSKCGGVLAINVLTHGEVGEVRVVYGFGAEAERCVAMMNGRKFDGRQLTARVAAAEAYDPPPPEQQVLPAAAAATDAAATSVAERPTAPAPGGGAGAAASSSSGAAAAAPSGDDLLNSFFASLPPDPPD